MRVRVHCARSELRGNTSGRFRLVVQMYRVDTPTHSFGMQARTMQAQAMQAQTARVSGKPLGFAERRVDLEQLMAGVEVDVVEFEAEPRGMRRLAAWLQRVDSHDDDHGMGARPADAQWHASEIWSGPEPVVLTLRRGAF